MPAAAANVDRNTGNFQALPFESVEIFVFTCAGHFIEVARDHAVVLSSHFF